MYTNQVFDVIECLIHGAVLYLWVLSMLWSRLKYDNEISHLYKQYFIHILNYCFEFNLFNYYFESNMFNYLFIHLFIVHIWNVYHIVDVNECSSSPCDNQAVCNDEINSYTCTCTTGWTGTHCNEGKYTHLFCYSSIQLFKHSCVQLSV